MKPYVRKPMEPSSTRLSIKRSCQKCGTHLLKDKLDQIGVKCSKSCKESDCKETSTVDHPSNEL